MGPVRENGVPGEGISSVCERNAVVRPHRPTQRDSDNAIDRPVSIHARPGDQQHTT
jgi:hypothetical protein